MADPFAPSDGLVGSLADDWMDEEGMSFYAFEGEYFASPVAPQYPAPGPVPFAPSSQGYDSVYATHPTWDSANLLASAFHHPSHFNPSFGLPASQSDMYTGLSPPVLDLQQTLPQMESQFSHILPRAHPAGFAPPDQGAMAMSGPAYAAASRPPTSPTEPKKRGRKGGLATTTRLTTAVNRERGSCLLHIAKKTSCATSYRDPTGGDDCDDCVKTHRICYRGKRLKTQLIDPLKLNSNPTLEAFVGELGGSAQHLPLRFEITVGSQPESFRSFVVELISSGARLSKARVVDDGAARPNTLAQLSQYLLETVEYRRSRSWDDGRVDLPDPAKKCLGWHALLLGLQRATVYSTSKPEDVQAVKFFIASLIEEATISLRQDLQLAILHVKQTIATRSMKVDDDPGHLHVAFALAALCRIVRDMVDGQAASPTPNSLSTTLSSAISRATPYYAELESLGHAFFAIKDSKPESAEFDQMVSEALPSELEVDLGIVFDPAKPESRLHLRRQDSGDKKWWNDMEALLPDGSEFTDSQLAEGYPLASLFAQSRSHGKDVFQYRRIRAAGDLSGGSADSSASPSLADQHWQTLHDPMFDDLYASFGEPLLPTQLPSSTTRTSHKRQSRAGVSKRSDRSRR